MCKNTFLSVVADSAVFNVGKRFTLMSVCGATVAGPKAQVGECVTGGEAGCDITGWEGEGPDEPKARALILALISSLQTVQTAAHSSNKPREGIRLDLVKTLVPAHLLCSTSGSAGFDPSWVGTEATPQSCMISLHFISFIRSKLVSVFLIYFN